MGDLWLHGFWENRCRLPNAMSWAKFEINNTDGTAAPEGMYYFRFSEGRLPREALVEAGTSEIPFRHLGSTICNATEHETGTRKCIFSPE